MKQPKLVRTILTMVLFFLSNAILLAQTNAFNLKYTIKGDGFFPLVADFDTDGDIDILIDKSLGYLTDYRIYQNDGAGNFPTFITINTTNVVYVAVGDLDDDGDIDLIDRNGRIYANGGAGNFTILTGVNILSGSGFIAAAKIVDINKDGKKDVVWGNEYAFDTTYKNQVWINTGTTGNASFTCYAKIDTYRDGPRNSIDVGDIDSDGDLDIITGGSSWYAQVIKNNNNGTFEAPVQIFTYSGGARLQDWDQDGDLDYVLFDRYNSFGLRVVKNDGSGDFTKPPIRLFNDTETGFNLVGVSKRCTTVDVNGDGFLDAVVDREDGGNAYVLINTGCKMVMQSYVMGRSTNGALVADFNNDGKPDVFCANRGGDTSAGSTIWLNDLIPVTTVPLSNISSTTGGEFINRGTVTLSATASNGGSVKWRNAATEGSLLANGNTFSTPVLTATTTYYASAINSKDCESDRVAVTATRIFVPLTASSSGGTISCNGGTTQVTVSATGGIAPYTGTGTFTVGAGTYTYTVTDADRSTVSTSITVTEPSMLKVASSSGTILCNGGSTTITINGNGGTAPYSGEGNFTVGAGTFTYTVLDANGCTASTSIIITEPTLNAAAQNKTIYLDANGNASITAAEIDNGSSDACGIKSISVSPSSFTCANIGANTVILTVTNHNGNSATATATVTVNPTPLPVANTDMFTLSSNAPFTFKATDLLGNDTDPLNKIIKVDIVNQPGTGTIVDNYNGTYTYTPATALNGSITATYLIKRDDGTTVDGGTTVFADNGHFYEFVPASAISWADAKAAAESRTYQGKKGYLTTITSKAENDLVKSILNGSAWMGASDQETEGVWKWETGPEKDIVFWNGKANGSAVSGTFSDWESGKQPDDIDNEDYAHFWDDPDHHKLWNDYRVTRNIIRISGYVVEYGGMPGDCNIETTATGTITFNLVDNTPPTAIAQNKTISLDANGNATITPAQINNGSNDQSGIASLVVSPSRFTCANIGANTVTLTVTDSNNNVATATATVTVLDTVKPTVITQNKTIYLDANGSASITSNDINNGSNDNCSSLAPFFEKTVTGTICGTANENQMVTLSAPIGAKITAIDFASYGTPSGNCANFQIGNCHSINSQSIVSAIALGKNTVSISATNAVFSDPCVGTGKRLYIKATWAIITRDSSKSITVSPGSFTCANVGANTVTLTVTDSSNNIATATAIVTVLDTIAPRIHCQANIVQFYDSITTAISVNLVNPKTADNCSIASITNNAPAVFKYGTTMVNWLTTDASGNMATCMQKVIITLLGSDKDSTDTDLDGFANGIDIDDDNDGVLDATEAPSCFYNESEAAKIIAISSELDPHSSYTAEKAIDGVATTYAAVKSGINWVGKEIYHLQVTTPVAIKGIQLDLVNWALSANTKKTFKLQGAVSNIGVWVDLSPVVASTATTGMFTINNTLAPNQAFDQFRLVGVEGISHHGGISEISLILNNYTPSAHQKAICSTDTDTDGILNYFDLDSDGDGCSDAYEAGATTDKTANFAFTSDVSLNGLADIVETSTDNGIINYPSSYDLLALSKTFKACADSDHDGVGDLADIDDDNDGVPDAIEAPSCFYNESEAAKIIAISSELAPHSSYTAEKAIDGVATTYAAVKSGINWVGKEIYHLQVTTPVAIKGIQLDLVNWALSANTKKTFKLQGAVSNIGVWVDLSPVVASTATAGMFTINNTLAPNQAFDQFRLVGVEGISHHGGISEISLILNNYTPSAHQKAICSTDTDGDGILNYLDIDSDGDGCSDAYEAGATNDLSTDYSFTGNVGVNGLLDSLETNPDNGTINYTSSYDTVGINAALSACNMNKTGETTVISTSNSNENSVANKQADIKQRTASMDFALYPNPAHGSMINATISGLQHNDKVQFKVYSVLGQMLIQSEVTSKNNYRFNLSKLTAGMYYMVYIINGNQVQSKPFIKGE